MLTASAEYLTLDEAREKAAALDAVCEAVGVPYADWRARCHEMSLKILRTGWFGPGRVARGYAIGVVGQHSWIVLGHDVYDPQAVIVDPTLRLWRKDPEPGITVGRCSELWHQPHGLGSCFTAVLPSHHGGPDIRLPASAQLSPVAWAWLAMVGPLDARGWMQVAHLPVSDWPAKEIITAMYETPALRAFIPIDIVGHLTEFNPNELYW